MPYYEHVFIARQDITAHQVDALANDLTAVVEEQGGSVTKKEYWGLKNLAYRIKKNRKGHYILLNLDAPAKAVHELERRVRFNEDIIRFLTMRVNELDENPSVQMQKGRDDRGGRKGDKGDKGDKADKGDKGKAEGGQA